MGEEENMQCENCADKNCNNNCLIGYDLCALVFCFYPLVTSIFGIDYNNASVMLQTSFKMIIFALFPFAISIVGLKKSKTNKTISPAIFSLVFIIMLIYAVLILVGITDGGQLF